METKKNYLKNPFNYIGGKFKLLDEIYPYFKQDMDVFYDIFGGGGEISVNLDIYGIKARKIMFYDKNRQLINIFYNLKHNGDTFIEDIKKLIKEYKLSKTNKEGYLKLREYYNKNCKNLMNYENSIVLYTLLSHSFNNFITFNLKDEYNVPFGMNRSTFNSSLEKKLENYIEKLSKLNIEFIYQDFQYINIKDIKEESFVYLDPPYYITTGAYERNSKTKWNEEIEIKLYEFLNKLDTNNIKFLLSNVLEHKGKINEILKTVIKEKLNYNLKILDYNYKNCNYQSKNQDKITKEIILFN